MGLRIIINDKEYTSPIVKYALAVAALIGTLAIAVFIIFVILPLIGISITALLGLVIALAIGIFAAAVALTLGGALLAAFIALVDFLANKLGRR